MVSLDPAVSSAYSSFAVLANVVEGLTAFDDDIKLVPALAESWEQSADELTWTFHLRKGVKFSNGREMTSEDVKFSFDRILDPKIGSGRVNSVGGEAQVRSARSLTFTIDHRQRPPRPSPLRAWRRGGRESVGEDGQIVVPSAQTIHHQDLQNHNMTLVKIPTTGRKVAYLDEIDITVIPKPGANALLDSGLYPQSGCPAMKR
jgi:ABC-type transport system substrate-binding protein